ncbi:MAG: ABC transporter permease [Planctomycetota bacterium]
MIAFELLFESVRNLWRHRLRSFLTALGIVFGIASVMAMVATGEGARRAILEQIQQLGIDNVIVNARKPPEEQKVESQPRSSQLRYGLTFRDAEQIRATLPGVAQVLEVHDATRWIWLRGRRLEAKVRGVRPEYLEHLGMRPVLGRALCEADEVARARVCVVRARLLGEMDYVGDPLQLDLRVGAEYLRVVGVLPDLGFQSPNKSVLGMDDRTLEVYVPHRTMIDRFGVEETNRSAGTYENSRVELHQIVCKTAPGASVLQVAKGIQQVLAHNHQRKDYEVVVPLELLESKQSTQRVFDIVLPIIAGISLLVGGIGILNIMLASITERTREIGIRRAIGASRADIVWQFLTETVVLAAAGGLLGVLLGVGFVAALRAFTEWQPTITPGSVALSMGVSCLTGIVFGIQPARRAALMDPIQALRHD